MAFSHGNHELGTVKNHEMGLKLTVQPPYPPILRKPPYPASPKAKKEIELHVETLVKMGVLVKVSDINENSVITPVVITWDHNKSRMCGDFRAINTYTVPEAYPMPRINHSLDAVKGAKYITTMDAFKGFHEIAVAPEVKSLLRIICHLGTYEYQYMPFGLKNASAVFQRLMDSEFNAFILQGWLRIYMDDFIIFSETFEEHITHLSLVLGKVVEIGMTISLKKSNFGFSSILALGHVISGLWIAIDKNKVAPMHLRPMPTNLKEMQSFLGFASYYRKYIEDFALISGPL